MDADETCQSVISGKQIDSYQRDGFLVIRDFISDDVCHMLIERANKLMSEFDPGSIKTAFSTHDQSHAKHLYFLDSGFKIHFFFEENALYQDGLLKFEKSKCINKFGHALHDLDPVFNCFSRTHKIATLVNNLGVINPLILQSMYICKQPHIGGEVTCHQDATYLYTSHQSVTGLWFALEDATLENGCLWAIPGGHHSPLKSRFIRHADNQTTNIKYDTTPWSHEKMVPLEVSQGSVIVLHGLLPHMSKANISHHSRHAYTLHVMPTDAEYAHDNWLQRPLDMPFTGFK